MSNYDLKTRKEQFSLPEGDVELVYPKDMTPDDVSDFIAWIELMKRKIQRIALKETRADALAEDVQRTLGLGGDER